MAEAIAERSPGGRYVRFMEKVGSGASKDVFRAYDTQEGIEVAWNVINLAGVPRNERNRIVSEVKRLEKLHHNNIINFYGSWVNRHKLEVHFICEIMSSGSLKSFINRIKVVRWKVAKRWAFQILKGLQYLHSQGVIHRDLKCDNIFINGTSGELRIGDLGLSTVHRNGRVLSVLGTPEFIAPEMYQDRPYDYKVDIYSFGMVMLEIFTRDIPYRECSNPAQIYRKVSRGELPASLGRIRSKEGKDFIMFCLGHKDEATGDYVRPTTTELLENDFFMKGNKDDCIVLVDNAPPGQLLEHEDEDGDDVLSTLDSVEGSHNSASNATVAASNPLLLRQQVQYQEQRSKNTVPQPRKQKATRSAGLSGGDQLLDMPENEQNFKKVSVMMGRDKPIGHGKKKSAQDKKNPSVNDSTAATTTTAALSQTSYGGSTTSHSTSLSSHGNASRASHSTAGDSSQVSQASEQKKADTKQAQTHYLEAAAVIKNENLEPGQQPFADNYLKLIITLPIQGHTQNVQFDFHLVEDDAVQVAKEMVEELGIPGEAVFEISETISGLARAARMQRDNTTAGVDASSDEGRSISSAALKGTSITSSNSSSSGSVSATYRQQKQNPMHHQQHRASSRLRQEQLKHQQQHHNLQQRHTANQRQQYNHPQHRQQQRQQQYGGQMLQQQPAQMRQRLQKPKLERRMSGDMSERGVKETAKEEELRLLEEEYERNILETTQRFDSNINSLKSSVDKNEEEHNSVMMKHEEERAKYASQMAQSQKDHDEKLDKLRHDHEAKRLGAISKEKDIQK